MCVFEQVKLVCYVKFSQHNRLELLFLGQVNSLK